MIVTPNIGLRIAGIVLMAVILQRCLFSMVTVFQVTPYLLPAVVVAFGLLGGSMTGTVVGFAIGMLSDALAAGPLGVSAIALMGVGYAAGLYRERGDVGGVLVAPIASGVLTVAALVVMAALYTLIGLEPALSFTLVWDTFVKGIYAFVVAFGLFVIIRRTLRPALIEDRATRRRRRPDVIGA